MIFLQFLDAQHLFRKSVAVARKHRFDTRNLDDIGADSVDHALLPAKRAAIMSAFISRIAFCQPTKTACATIAWPIFSSITGAPASAAAWICSVAASMNKLT